MTARRPWRRCLACDKRAHWVDPAWVCTGCGREWTQALDRRYAPPGGPTVDLATCSYSEYRPDMGLGVRISLGTPRWIRREEPWPYVPQAAPSKAYLNVTDEAVFLDRYLAQLRTHGVAGIRERLEEIATRAKADRLVLLCFEKLTKGEPCHRRYFASWWYTETGQEIPELGEVPTHEQLSLFGDGS